MKQKMFLIFFGLIQTFIVGCATTEDNSQLGESSSVKWISIYAGDKPMPVKFHPSAKSGKSPTVFILHGTNGPDARGEHWAKFFNKSGYNALQVDFKTGRFSGASDRLNVIPSSLIDHALAWLLKQPTVDENSLVWMGMSYGGSVGMTLEQSRWSAFILFYPGCWNHTKTQSPKPPHYWAYHAEKPRTKPTLIVWGTADEYEEGKYCPEMVKLMSGPVETLALDGAHHGFDGNISVRFTDYVSPSGRSSLQPNTKARAIVESKISEFLKLNAP